MIIVGENLIWLPKAISTCNSAATRYYLHAMTRNAFTNQGVCLTPAFETVMS